MASKKIMQQAVNQLLKNRQFRTFLRSPKGMVVGVVLVLALLFTQMWPNASLPPESAVSSTASTALKIKGEYLLEGQVSHVADGDTINLMVQGERQRIRLANIDAPESYGRSDRPGQPYAEDSTKALAAMVGNQRLTVHCFEQDRYGRHVCNVLLPNGKVANEELVAQGLAWAYTGSNERYLRDKSLKQVQAQAQAAGVGLWQGKNPTAPWVWRSECWQKKQCN